MFTKYLGHTKNAGYGFLQMIPFAKSVAG